MLRAESERLLFGIWYPVSSIQSSLNQLSRMWIQRTPEELAQWQIDSDKQARSDGLTVGVIAWVGSVLLMSGGWLVSFSSGVAVQRSFGGTFWTRLPIIALLGLPVLFIARRLESRKALRKSQLRTICPKCDTAAEANAGSACPCGGTFVFSSTMKWVE